MNLVSHTVFALVSYPLQVSGVTLQKIQTHFQPTVAIDNLPGTRKTLRPSICDTRGLKLLTTALLILFEMSPIIGKVPTIVISSKFTKFTHFFVSIEDIFSYKHQSTQLSGKHWINSSGNFRSRKIRNFLEYIYPQDFLLQNKTCTLNSHNIDYSFDQTKIMQKVY